MPPIAGIERRRNNEYQRISGLLYGAQRDDSAVKPAQAEGNVKPTTNETSILPYNFPKGDASCVERYAGGYGASSETWSVNPGSVSMQPPWWGAQCRATLCYFYCINGVCYNPCYSYAAIGNPELQPLCPAGFNYLNGMCKTNTCPAHSTASGATCICDTGYRPDASATFCLPDRLVIKLEGGNTTEPATSMPFKAIVTDYAGKPAAAGVTLSVEVEAGTGGHEHHDANRPKGTVPGSGATGADGVWDFAFTATEVAGTHTITAKCDRCDNTATARVDVKVEGLVPISGSPFYVFIGATNAHSDNHYLTPAAEALLKGLAVAYQFEPRFQINGVTPPPLHINDASLVWGGKFDIKGNWGGDHQAHKRGAVIDIRANTASGAMPESLFTEFEKLAKKTKLADGTSAIAQVHCSKGRDPAIDNCNGDPNRHYHVILLGVDQ